MSAIEIVKLKKYFGKIAAVNGISLKIEEGEIFAILGPNGAGKTTTIFMLCGLLQPDEGTATVAGFDVTREPFKVRQKIGVVFQSPSVDDLLTGRENLEMHAMLYGMPLDQIGKRIDTMLRLVGLEERQHSQVREYSGGMRRRLEIARGLLHHPKVLFLDEPTIGLDPQTRQHIWNYIRRLSEKEKVTIVFTTHYLEEAERFADRVAIIDKGKIIAVGQPKRLIESLGGDTAFFKTAQPEKVASKMKKMNGILNVKVIGDQIKATVKNPQKQLPIIFRRFRSIKSVALQPATLNDLFMKYTGKQIREEEGEGGYHERIMRSQRE
ncbi:MAG: ATP-binding cassette domain-containing protein [Candidatus Micrarchaeota archaeon]|nr:ATP-binding cassette domain-containing protein [Candidatus Micrarchaeota archaeon]